MKGSSTLAKQAWALKRAAAPRSALPALFLLTDTRRLPDPRPAVAALPPGAGVILRHYDVADREALARDLHALCRRKGLRLLVAGNVRLASRIGADGVHLPEHMAGSIVGARRIGLPLITVAAHSRAALHRAASSGADAALLSPVFATESHPAARCLGPVRFAALARVAELPVYALGGVNARTAQRLTGSHAAGLAAIDGLVPGSAAGRPFSP